MTKTLLTERAVEEYNEKFGKPDYTGRNFFETYGQMLDREKEALRYYYEQHENPEAKAANEHRANTTRQQLASGTSIVGTALSLVPHPVTRVSGAVLNIPDQVYDLAALSAEPSMSNAGHVAVDYPELVGKIIPGKWDDAVLAGLKTISTIDD